MGHPDLTGRSSWPKFAAASVAHGYLSVCAIPMRIKDFTMGCLNLFMTEPTVIAPADVALARGLADVATIAISQNRLTEDAAVREAQLRHGEIGRSPSTVSRELRRNAATRGGKLDYRASVAQWKAELVARRPKTAKLVANPLLREYVRQRLAGEVRRLDGGVVGPSAGAWTGRNMRRRSDRRWVTAWSPEQISQRLRVDFPDDVSMRISHEAIYQALYIQSRGALQRELIACLRTGRALRMPRARSKRTTWAHVTPEVMISERPAEAEDRAVPGHWEGDLIIGLERSAIGTLVERHDRSQKSAQRVVKTEQEEDANCDKPERSPSAPSTR